MGEFGGKCTPHRGHLWFVTSFIQSNILLVWGMLKGNTDLPEKVCLVWWADPPGKSPPHLLRSFACSPPPSCRTGSTRSYSYLLRMGHEIELSYFDKKCKLLGVNRNLNFVDILTSKMSLCWSVLIAIFYAVKEQTYGRNSNIIWCLPQRN